MVKLDKMDISLGSIRCYVNYCIASVLLIVSAELKSCRQRQSFVVDVVVPKMSLLRSSFKLTILCFVGSYLLL